MMTLDLQRVNACSPYVLQESSRPLLYEFITDYGIDYTIGFALSDLLPGVECYEFVIINSNNRKSLRDYKLRETVYALIYEFFSQPDAVMIYLCDTSDGKQEVRQRLFASWFYSADRGVCTCGAALSREARMKTGRFVPDSHKLINLCFFFMDKSVSLCAFMSFGINNLKIKKNGTRRRFQEIGFAL